MWNPHAKNPIESIPKLGTPIASRNAAPSESARAWAAFAGARSVKASGTMQPPITASPTSEGYQPAPPIAICANGG